MKGHFEKAEIPSVVLAKTTKDGERTIYSFGPSKWKQNDTVSENHLFRIFSMTKPIITVAALQLVEQGRVKLEEPLNDLLPEMLEIPILNEEDSLYHSSKALTLKHLLNHTSGFGYNFIYERLRNFNSDSWNYVDYPKLFDPGEGWAYGTSIEWVGKVVEKITNKSLEEYVTTNIIEPLEMHRTFFVLPQGMEDKLVSWGVRNGDLKKITELPLIDENKKPNNSAKTLYSTVNDYLNFIEFILNKGSFKGKRILLPETVNLMFNNSLPEGMSLDYGSSLHETFMENFLDSKDIWGLGWALEANINETIRPQNAAYWTGSANTYFTIAYDKGIGLVYFSQILPFNDEKSVRLYRIFEKEVFNTD